MNEEKNKAENLLILKRLSRNSKSCVIPIILPNIKNNNSLPSLSLNLSSDINSGLSKNLINNKQNYSEIRSYQKKVNLNLKLFKILNNSVIKPPKNIKKYKKNKLFGEEAHNIAIEKMKNYYEGHNSFNNEENETQNKTFENNLKNTNKNYQCSIKSLFLITNKFNS